MLFACWITKATETNTKYLKLILDKQLIPINLVKCFTATLTKVQNYLRNLFMICLAKLYVSRRS